MAIHELDRGLTAKNQDSQSCCLALAARGCRGEARAGLRAPHDARPANNVFENLDG